LISSATWPNRHLSERLDQQGEMPEFGPKLMTGIKVLGKFLGAVAAANAAANATAGQCYADPNGGVQW